MKKTAILALAVAMPAMAGTPTVVTVPVPAPAPAAVAPACCALEVAAAYNFAARDLAPVGESVDTYGVDLTAVHSFTPNHAATLRLGYTYGSEIDRIFGDRDQIQTISLMPGYRYTTPLCDTTSLFAGVNVGVAHTKLDLRNDNDSDWGLAASAELGISKKICDKVSVFAAYQLSGNTAQPGFGEGIKKQVYNGVRAGLNIQF